MIRVSDMSEKYLINIIKDYTDEQLETLAAALRADKEQTKIGEKLFIDLVNAVIKRRVNYSILLDDEGKKYIKCKLCGGTSNSYDDIKFKYCPHCKKDLFLK